MKKYLNKSVYVVTNERIKYIFDNAKDLVDKEVILNGLIRNN